MTLWVNRLYPKPRERNRALANAEQGKSGDMNFYYTLPVTGYETNYNAVENTQNTRVETIHEETANIRNNRVRSVRNTHDSRVEEAHVTYQTNVQVDMVNHNQIHGEQDMHRLVEYLRDALEETLMSSAEGVV